MQINEQDFCFFGKETLIKGELNLSGEIHLSCVVEGDIKVLTETTISIEPHGKVIGTINAKNIDVYGQVTGEIIATGTLRIFPSAKVEGKLSANSLIIKPGAFVNIIGHTKE